MNEELLETTLSLLKSNVDIAMYEVNSLLSSTDYKKNAAKILATKISKLSKANYNYQQGLNLKAQLMKIKIESLMENQPADKKEE